MRGEASEGAFDVSKDTRESLAQYPREIHDDVAVTRGDVAEAGDGADLLCLVYGFRPYGPGARV